MALHKLRVAVDAVGDSEGTATTTVVGSGATTVEAIVVVSGVGTANMAVSEVGTANMVVSEVGIASMVSGAGTASVEGTVDSGAVNEVVIGVVSSSF